MVIKRVIPKTIREVATNLQSANVKSFTIYEVNNRNELDFVKQSISSNWSQQNSQKTRISVIAVVEHVEADKSH